MLGIFMMIAEIAARFYVTTDARREEIKRRREARENGKEFYVDRYGTQHYVKNDRPFAIRNDFNYDTMTFGDQWEVNPYTGEKIRNISAEIRRKIDLEEKQKAISKGQKYYAFEGPSATHSTDKVVGHRYKNMDTGKVYVLREYDGVKLLVNLTTGLAEDWDRVGLDKRKQQFRELNNRELRLWVPIGVDKYGFPNIERIEATDENMQFLLEKYNSNVKRNIEERNDPWFGNNDVVKNAFLIL